MDHEEVSLIATNTVYFYESQCWQEQTPVGVSCVVNYSWQVRLDMQLVVWAVGALAVI